MVHRQVCIQRTHNGGLGMPDLESHWFTERLAYLCRSLSGNAVLRRKASKTFPCFKSDPKAEGRCKLMGETPFVRKCHTTLHNLSGSSNLLQSRKELYWKLVVGSTSDSLSERHSQMVEEICSHFPKILESNLYKFILPILTMPDSAFFSFAPLDYEPIPLRVGPACFQCSQTLENSRSPYRRSGDGRATKIIHSIWGFK